MVEIINRVSDIRCIFKQKIKHRELS